MDHRAGFVSIVGRPNSGKSTLLNALVGQKVAITSDKPQTTRHVVRGIVDRPHAQVVFVDTPGVHRPRTLLGERLNDEVRGTLSEVDVVAVTIPADESVGPGDRFVAREAMSRPAPQVAVVTKADLVTPDRLAVQLLAVQRLAGELGFDWAEVVPVSAVSGFQVGLLVDLVSALLPEGPALYPVGEVTDEPLLARIAELVREAALDGVREELPHSIAVVVDDIEARSGRPSSRPLTDVRATLFVERDSQKAIVIGQGGRRLRDVGAAARREIEPLVGTPVFLDLRVKVAKDWQRDPRQLRRMGF